MRFIFAMLKIANFRLNLIRADFEKIRSNIKMVNFKIDNS